MVSFKSPFRVLTVVSLLVPCCFAQQDLQTGDAQPTEPWVLKQMLLQSHPETRLALLNQLHGDFQKAELISWAYGQICEAFEEAKQLDRALAAGEHLLALDPQELEVAQRGLKVAEKTQDAALVRKWAAIAARVADTILSSATEGKNRLELAHSLRVYTDYLDYSDILSIADPAGKRERVEDFLKSHKDSAYRAAAEDLYLEAWRESGDAKKTLAAARRILEQDENNVTALTIVAESYLESENEPKRLATYGARILALLDHLPKPEGPAAGEWLKKKAALAGRAHWMIGTAAIQQEKFSEADKSIRAALPFLKADNRMTSAALFYLGWANYKMGKLSDAIRFNKECTLVKGPFREHAEKNLRVIQAETTPGN